MLEIQIPKDVSVELSGQVLIVKGPKGSNKRIIPSLMSFSTKGNVISLDVKKNAKVKALALEHTYRSHINNMFKGVTEGFHKDLKLIYSHFPFTLEKKGNDIIIKNFLGEKVPRKAKVYGDVDIKISKSGVTLSSLDIESIGQTYLSLKRATKIKDKDPRVFQDGLY